MEATIGTKFDDLRKKCKEYVAKRRLEANIKSKDVEMGNMEEEKWSLDQWEEWCE